ncbi:integrase core domain-containing protein [Streptomyces sp. IBSBF 3010]|uniref:integrase core domain-containing protein n=1 Tax=Streptomyces sp. IBSBF 3010 TaxID=2903526 RepID=UPI003FA68CA7
MLRNWVRAAGGSRPRGRRTREPALAPTPLEFRRGDALVNRFPVRGRPSAPLRREAALQHPRRQPLELLLLACRSAGVRRSMSVVGSSADNVLAESFNATFKRETLQGRKSWSNERGTRLDAFRWLHRYNKHPTPAVPPRTTITDRLRERPPPHQTTLAPAAYVAAQ